MLSIGFDRVVVIRRTVAKVGPQEQVCAFGLDQQASPWTQVPSGLRRSNHPEEHPWIDRRW